MDLGKNRSWKMQSIIKVRDETATGGSITVKPLLFGHLCSL